MRVKKSACTNKNKILFAASFQWPKSMFLILASLLHATVKYKTPYAIFWSNKKSGQIQTKF